MEKARRGALAFAERRRLLQTGRTGLRGQFIANKWVTLVRRRISPEFIVYYSAGPRDDIGPCLLVVALMSLIAPPVRKRIAASHRPDSHGSQQTLKRVPPFPSPSSFIPRSVRIKIAMHAGNVIPFLASPRVNLQLIGIARNRIPIEENQTEELGEREKRKERGTKKSRDVVN